MEDMKALENEMVLHLDKHIHPRLKDRWAEFDRRLSAHLGAVCRGGLTDIYKAFDALKDGLVIKTGRYGELRGMLEPIDVEMGKIIDAYTAKMLGDGATHTKDSRDDKDIKDSNVTERMKKLENEMTVELSHYLHPGLKKNWDNFDCLLSTYLDVVCRERMENIFMVIEELTNQKIIKLGKYDVLKQLVQPIHVDMEKIIDEYTAKIRALIEGEPVASE